MDKKFKSGASCYLMTTVQTREGTITPVVLERTKAAADTDNATRQTVEKMCSYIRLGVADELVKRCADYAWRRFGMGQDSPEMKCWGVFWWVKHCVSFRLDEATMFRVGEQNQQDLLIAPPVLVRMQDPAEDCDGFTMLAAAMLTVLGVPVVIATVAADPDTPDRWSHVFPVALLPHGGVLPIDASHGKAPGWMVPPEQIFRWQAWDLDGKRAAVEPMRYRGLHNYVPMARRRPRRGVGSALGFDFTPPDDYVQFSGPPISYDSWGNVTGGPSGSNTDWSSFFQSLAGQGMKLVSSIFTPPAYQQLVRDPVTGQMVSTTVRNTATAATVAGAGAGSLSSPNWPLWIGGGVLALVALKAVAGKR